MTHADLVIHKAGTEDLETVVDVYYESFVPVVRTHHENIDPSLTDRRNLTSMWKEILENDSNVVFLAARDATSSPSAVLAFRQSETPQTIELVKLFVVPSAQSSGLARSFYEFGEAFAIEQGYQSIELWKWEVTLQSRRFYEKLGFVDSSDRGKSGYLGVKPEDDVTIRYVKQISV